MNGRIIGVDIAVVIAICGFMLCIRLKVTSSWLQRLIMILSSTSLGVYLIHKQPFFFEEVFCNAIRKIGVCDVPEYFVKLSLVTIVVYGLCTFLDFLRFRFLKLLERIRIIEMSLSNWNNLMSSVLWRIK